MEENADREYEETTATLLQEVSLSFPSVLDQTPPAATGVSVPMPDSVMDFTMSGPSSCSSLPSNADAEM